MNGSGSTAWLIRTESNGDSLWTRTFNNCDSDFAHGTPLQITNDGGFVFVCNKHNPPNGLWIVKTDATGNTLWDKIYQGECYQQGRAIKQLYDGGFILGGDYRSWQEPGSDALLFRTDSIGDTLWTWRIGDERSEVFYDFDLTSDGGLIALGLIGDLSLEGDIWLAKVTPEKVIADFKADPVVGTIPFTVAFIDQSSKNVMYWRWDFDSDGITDSEVKNPIRTFTEGNFYSVSLEAASPFIAYTVEKKNYIVAIGEKPMISQIKDVPEDQGGWVEVKFYKSMFDTEFSNSTFGNEKYVIEAKVTGDWIRVDSISAIDQQDYSVIVRTFRDSTKSSQAVHDFRIWALMDEGAFVSDPVAGYSVDNLIPQPPTNLHAFITENDDLQLEWDPSLEPDFSYFIVYRGDISSNEPIFFPLARTRDTKYIDTDIAANRIYYYVLTATDSSENESAYSEVIAGLFTPMKFKTKNFACTHNFPNPFRQLTTVRMRLFKHSNVKISIHDILGRQVIQLYDEHADAGEYYFNWNGVDNEGNLASTGVYFCIIQIGGEYVRLKMLFLKNMNAGR
jgi:PKD repeat protein